MDTQFVYIVFSATPYRIGKFIRAFTKETYNHASIALDEQLTRMYGFSRRYYRTPFYGGFVRESLSRYHVCGKATDVRICRLPVTKAQYEALEQLLLQMEQEQERYLYNHLSAAACLFRRPVKIKDAYTCIEFCVRILKDLGIDVDPDQYYTVGQVEQLLRAYAIYTGPMPQPQEYDAVYYAPKPVAHPTFTTFKAIAALLRR